MKILSYIFLLIGFALSAELNISGNDITAFSYEEKSGVLATADLNDTLNFTNVKTKEKIKTVTQIPASSLAFYDGELYVGLRSGAIVKFSKGYLAKDKIIDESNLKIYEKVSRLEIKNNKIHAIVGKNNLVIFDLKSKNLKIVNLPDVYNVSAFAVLKDKAVIASWDRRVFEVNFSDFTPKELFKTPGVALSAACNDEVGEVIFGLSDGKILNLNQNEIAQIRDESILVIKKIKDITYFGTASGKIYQSDTNIHTIKQNIIFSDRIISFLYDEGSIMALLLNGEIRSVAKR